MPIRITRKCGKLGGMNREETKNRERERTPNNRTTTGFRISDELWAVLEPLLPVHVNTHRFGRDAHPAAMISYRSNVGALQT